MFYACHFVLQIHWTIEVCAYLDIEQHISLKKVYNQKTVIKNHSSYAKSNVTDHENASTVRKAITMYHTEV